MTSLSSPRCVITGCALVCPQEDFSVYGDLHEVGDCWVFNAVLQKGEANRNYWNGARPLDWVKQIVLDEFLEQPYFERRGVFVFTKTSAELNQAAKDYIK